jgi:hypothetical protein
MAEIERAKEKGQDVKELKFNVIIQHKEPITLPGQMKKKEALEKLEALAAKKQTSIISNFQIKQLRAIRKFKLLPLANPIFCGIN